MRWVLVLGVAAAVGCAGVSKEQYRAKETEAEQARQELATLESRAQGLEQEQAALEQQQQTLQTQVRTTRSELDTTAAKLKERSAEYAELKAQTMRLGEPVLFKENSSKLSPEGRRSLDAMADAIRQLDGKAVLVAGYTDDVEAGGKDAMARRRQLSTSRALEVAKYLAGRDLDPARIGIAGFGQASPVAENDTLANQALNRRAELVITPENLELGTVEVSPAKVEKQ